MTKLPLLRNRRFITLFLLIISLLLGGIAIFLAITINSRNVNPDETAAGECVDYSMNNQNYNCKGYCDSTTCPGMSFCCEPGTDCSAAARCPESKCTVEDRGTKCGAEVGCPEGQGIHKRIRKCEGKPDEDVSDKSCTPISYCEAPKMLKCKEYDNNAPNNGCPSTLPIKKCALYCLTCPNPDGSGGQGCVETCSECGGTGAPSATPNPSIDPPNTSNWPTGATCRYEAGGGKCARAEFKGGACNPGPGQMCYCRNEIITLKDPIDGKEYRYGTVVLGPLACGAECSSEGKSKGGYFSDTSCGNTYYCKPRISTIPTPTPPPQPTCTNECIKDTNIWVTYCTPPGGTKQEVFRTEGSYCGEIITTKCPEKTECEGTDLVKRDCKGKELARQELYPPCLPPEEKKPGSCASLTVSYSSKSATSNNPALGTPIIIDQMPAAGQQIRFNSTPSGSSVVSIYWMRPYYKYPPNNNFDIVGSIEHKCGFYIFDPRNSQNGTFTMPSDLSRVVRNDTYGRNNGCGNYPVDYTKADGVIFGANFLPDANTPFGDALWCRNIGPNPNQGSTFKGITSLGTKCDNPCVILAKQEKVGTCESLTVSYSNKTATSNNPALGTPVTIDKMPGAGQQITFNSTGKNPSRLAIYWMRPYIKDPNNELNQFGNIKHACSFYVFDPRNSQNGTFTMPSDLSRVVRNDTYGRNNGCGNYPVDYTKADGVIFGANFLPDANTPFGDALWCRNIGPNPNQGSIFRGTIPQNQSCNNPCVIKASQSRVTPSTCTGLSITNTRNNATCNSTNPQNCQVRQGDTLNATVSGSGNVQGYSLSTIANPGSMQQNRSVQQSPTFTSITVPNNVALKSFELVGYTSNGETEVTSNSCRIRFDFSTNTEIQKTINSSGSTGLGSNNVVTTGSVVEYDVTVTNNGSSVLQNVIVYDRIVQIDNGTLNSTTTPFGNILSASNLSRTTGTLSQPNPVTPKQGYPSNAVPFSGTAVPGGTFTSAQGIKLVTWNPITIFHPSETYTGKVRVEIANYTGTPVLRNYVCVVVDTNNNGQPDNGELEKCAYQDVNTSTPEFTITKTSSSSSLTPGNSLTYTLTLRNTSSNPLSLSDVTVTDTFDSRYISRVTINPQNGGSFSGNIITWDGSDLVAANGGNTQLAPNGTITLTIQVTFNSNFFPSRDTCEAVVDNSVVASSSSPDFTTPPSIVQITMNNPQCGVEPTATPTPSGQPDTGLDTPIYLPIGGLLILLSGIGTYLLGRKYGPFTMRSQTNKPYSPIEELRKKIRRVK